MWSSQPCFLFPHQGAHPCFPTWARACHFAIDSCLLSVTQSAWGCPGYLLSRKVSRQEPGLSRRFLLWLNADSRTGKCCHNVTQVSAAFQQTLLWRGGFVPAGLRGSFWSTWNSHLLLRIWAVMEMVISTNQCMQPKCMDLVSSRRTEFLLGT